MSIMPPPRGPYYPNREDTYLKMDKIAKIKLVTFLRKLGLTSVVPTWRLFI